MSLNFVDLEPEIVLFLADKGITGTIFKQKIPDNAAGDPLVMIADDANGGPIPFEAPIDAVRVMVVVRGKHPLTAKTKALEIANVIHAATPGKLHPTSSLFLLSASIDERPQRTDNEDTDRPEFVAFYVFRVKPL